MSSASSAPFLMAVPYITDRLRSIVHILTCHCVGISGDLKNDIPIKVIHICGMISTMLESNSDLNIDEINLIGTAIDVMDEQVNLLKDQPGRSLKALTAFKELLSKVIDLLRERREARDLAEPSSKSPEWIEAVWENFNKAVDEHASESEDPDGVRDIYNDLIDQFILEGQERCMISKRSDPRRSLKVLVVVEDLTRGLIKLRNTPP